MSRKFTALDSENDTTLYNSDRKSYSDSKMSSTASIDRKLGNVFVTVGTTNFNDLIVRLNTETMAQILIQRGCTNLTIQIGHGEAEPDIVCDFVKRFGINAEWYRFKNSLAADMENATVVISHAGAGSIMEGLSLKKIMIVVINQSLMDNHQIELANELSRRNHIVSSNCNDVQAVLEHFDTFVDLLPYPQPNLNNFPQYVDQMLGFE